MRCQSIRASAGQILSLLVALATTLALLAVPATAQTEPPEQEQPQPARVSGGDRFGSAARVSELTFPDPDDVDVVHLATGQNHPDALAATYAAGAVEGPILLTARTTLPAATLAEIERLSPETVVIIGGTGVVSQAVEDSIAAAGYTTDRISGVDRFQTASSVALVYGRDQGIVGTVDGDRTAILASGEAFPDALAIGPIAAALNLPLFLTPSGTTEVSVNSSLQQLDIDRIIIVGGEAAVSADVEAFYRDGYVVERIAGANRMATAAAIADVAIERFGFTPSLSLLARGDDYPDALTAGIHGAMAGAPILLTATPTALSAPTSGWFADACPDVDAIRAVGGTAAISEAVLGAAIEAASTCLADTWTSCTNPDAGYTVEHPADWATNEDHLDRLPPCSLFDPDPEQIRVEGMEVPGDVGAFLRAEAVDFDEVTQPDPIAEEELDREDTTVDGRAAVRLETRATGTGLYPEGTLSTTWFVDLGETTFIAVSRSLGEPGYEVKTGVLDEMMQRIAFADGPDGAAIAAVTDDGRVVALDADTGAERRVLLEDVEVDDPASNSIAVSPDGSQVYVSDPPPPDSPTTATQIVRVPMAGGEPEVVTEGSAPAVSPDGATLAYVELDDRDIIPQPVLVLRDIASGEERRLTRQEPFRLIGDLDWTAHGTELAFTAGEIYLGAYVVAADAASLDEARRLGPDLDELGQETSWPSLAPFGDGRLAIIDRCCDLADPERWRIVVVDPDDGSVDGPLVPVERLEAGRVDTDAHGSRVLIVTGGPEGGDLLRWDGAGQPQGIAEGVLAAAW